MLYDAVIIGAGIAGAAIAYELQKRGKNILVVEAAPNIASGASGNAKGMIKPWLALSDSPMRQFYTAAYFHSLDILQKFPDVILQTGIIQFPKPDETRFASAPERSGYDARHLQYLTAAQAGDLLQTTVQSDALFWPTAAVISPIAWVRALLGTTPVQTETEITELTHHQHWHCQAKSGKVISARQVLIATGHAMDLLPDIAAELRPRMGQVTMAPAATLSQLPHAISFGHYFIPSIHGEDHIIGATYDHGDQAIVTAAGHRKNIDALEKMTEVIPALFRNDNLSPAQCTGRVAVRATTANHLPLYGKAAENLFYLTGLGSRGLMSAPYAAAQLFYQTEN